MRFRLPPGEVTPGQMAQVLRDQGAQEETVTRARDQMERLLESRFGASDRSMDEIHRGVCRVVDELEKLRK